MGIFDAISDREWEEYSESPEQAASSKSENASIGELLADAKADVEQAEMELNKVKSEMLPSCPKELDLYGKVKTIYKAADAVRKAADKADKMMQQVDAAAKSATEVAEKLENTAKQADELYNTCETHCIAAEAKKLTEEAKENREEAEAEAAGEGVGTKAWPDSKALFTNWETGWSTDENTVENRTAFRNWFTSLYDKLEVEADKHRDLNFQKKSRFLILVRLCTVVIVSAILGYCIVCGVSKSLVFKPDVFLALMGSVSLLALLFLYPFAKWIDVKKYQETWARHRAQLDRMQIAMVKFLYVTPPQGAPDRYQQFVIDILKTEEDTMESFQKMLQTQEKAIFSESLFGMK